LEPGRDPLSDLDALERELAQYEGTFGELLGKPRLVVLNKVDVPDARDLADLVRPELESRGLPVFLVSAATHEGLRELGFALADAVERDRAARALPEQQRIVITPRAVDDTGFTVEPDPQEPGGFVVRGAKPERWVRQTAFDNDEAVGYLGDRLARLGVEKQLAELGARRGAAVTIGDVTFDWEPSGGVDPDYQPTRRGEDIRLETGAKRSSAADRLAAKRQRHRHPGDPDAHLDAHVDDRRDADPDDRRRADGAGDQGSW
jgi:GTP-binding protein